MGCGNIAVVRGNYGIADDLPNGVIDLVPAAVVRGCRGAAVADAVHVSVYVAGLGAAMTGPQGSRDGCIRSVLPAGVYTVRVTDAAEASAQARFQVT